MSAVYDQHQNTRLAPHFSFFFKNIEFFSAVKLCCLTLSIGWAELAEIKGDLKNCAGGREMEIQRIKNTCPFLSPPLFFILYKFCIFFVNKE